MTLPRFLRGLIVSVCVFVLLWPALALAQAECAYTVQRGDTLYRIALRNGTTVEALVRLNSLANPNRLYAGQVLLLPGAGCADQGAAATPTAAAPTAATATPAASQEYIVQRGDTLTRIAARYGTTAAAVAVANGIVNPALIYAGQRLVIPSAGTAMVTPATPALASLAPATPEQGRTVRVSVPAADIAALGGALGAWPVQFFREGDTYVGLLGIDAWAAPGQYALTLNLTDVAGAVRTVAQPVYVAPGGYWSETLYLNAEKSALLEPQLVAAERARVAAMVAPVTPTRYWQGLFQMPAGGRTTSWFGMRRSYNGGPYSSYHDGIDLSVAGGWNVAAPAAGVVVLAEPLQVRGNVTIIDHGWGVYSGFWHQSAISVQVGEVVQAGQIIGVIGNTGLSTGAHLHWALFVGGVPVDPTQWTRQVFP